MYYYQRLKDMREDHDLKQEAVAKIIDTTQEQYSRYERGQREIPLHSMVKLAEFYNVSMDYMCGLIDTPKQLRRR